MRVSKSGCRVYWTVRPRKQKLKGVGAVLLPGTTRSTAVIGVPDTNAVPLLSQHFVLRLERGIVFVVGLVDAGK
jgi:hypothetical protein